MIAKVKSRKIFILIVGLLFSRTTATEASDAREIAEILKTKEEYEMRRSYTVAFTTIVTTILTVVVAPFPKKLAAAIFSLPPRQDS